MNLDLAQRAEALTTSVASLNESVRLLAASHARLRNVTRWIVAGLIAGLAFVVIAVVLFVQQQQVDERLAYNSGRIERIQARTSDEVLCPLYNLLIAFEPRSTTNPGLASQERAQREQLYEVIHRGHTALGCR